VLSCDPVAIRYLAHMEHMGHMAGRINGLESRERMRATARGTAHHSGGPLIVFPRNH
jgi:hypothetical protein